MLLSEHLSLPDVPDIVWGDSAPVHQLFQGWLDQRCKVAVSVQDWTPKKECQVFFIQILFVDVLLNIIDVSFDLIDVSLDIIDVSLNIIDMSLDIIDVSLNIIDVSLNIVHSF